MKLALGQINTMPSDIAGNVAKIVQYWEESETAGKDVLFTPEQSISGYPLEDRAVNPDLLDAVKIARMALMKKSETMATALGIGYPERGADGRVYNAYEIIQSGQSVQKQYKHDLPNSDVFDEKRIYGEGELPEPFELNGHKIGLSICEDTWHPEVIGYLAERGAEAIISVNASPYFAGKQTLRLNEVIGQRQKETGLPIAYVNQVGGVDEIVFDGHSCAVNADGSVALQAEGFVEGLYDLDLEFTPQGAVFKNGTIAVLEEKHEEIWKALVTGTRDYTRKTGFSEVVIGMSGGIDSALVAAIAADAIGAENVHLVKMPSKHSSPHSISDADEGARLLGAPIVEIPIQDAVSVLDQSVSTHFNPNANPKAVAVARENEQARTRGTILMTLSNANHWLLLSTGNKSEIAVGYCTLYGDMNGGFNPLKDVPKMLVYELANYRNEHCPDGMLGAKGMVVPQNIIDKAPSAELAPDQFDQDSLPPYPILDGILERYVEQDQPAAQIAQEMAIEPALVDDVIGKVDRAEFKRRQSCPCVKITERAFGKGRRVPIVGTELPKVSAAAANLIL